MRIAQPKKYRKPCYLFVDEAQNYISSESTDLILKEARKFAVFLVLANQNLSDIKPKALLQSLLNNTDVKLIGRNGNSPITTLAREVGVKKERITFLKKFHFLLKSGDQRAFVFKNTMMLNQPFFKVRKVHTKRFRTRILKSFYKKIKKERFVIHKEMPRFKI